MKLEREKILRMFAGLAGFSIPEAEEEQTLCDMSAGELERRLIPEAVRTEDMDRLCYAAAAGAFYRFCLARASREDGSFKLGDVSASSGGADAAHAAGCVYRDALALVSGLLSDEGFLFSRM